MKAFHAYDIRGVYDRDFNKGDVYKIGFFLPQLLNTNKVLVGRDVRISSNEIFEALTHGINDAGADVYDIGIATTPMVYYSTAKNNFDASVQITASHNPKEYNGLKVSRTNACPVGFDTGLGELEQMVLNNQVVPVAMRGNIISLDVRQEYIEFQKKYLKDLSNLKIGIDCSNGMAALLIKDILGDAPIYIYDTLDGTFPNHEANPLVAENIVDLQKLVIENKCDIGVIFDGDADRVMFVDENAKFVSPDLMIAVLAYYFKGKGGKVLQDIRSSKAVKEFVEKFGFEMHTWRVGRAYAALKLREIDGLFGGELAGHYYFKDFFYSDSGIIAALILLGIFADLKREGKTVSEIISGISAYHNSGEMNFKIENKAEAMKAVCDYFTSIEKPTATFDFDGFRIEFADWWFNIRPSNTEPYLRFITEAKSDAMLTNIIDEVLKILKNF